MCVSHELIVIVMRLKGECHFVMVIGRGDKDVQAIVEREFGSVAIRKIIESVGLIPGLVVGEHATQLLAGQARSLQAWRSCGFSRMRRILGKGFIETPK